MGSKRQTYHTIANCNIRYIIVIITILLYFTGGIVFGPRSQLVLPPEMSGTGNMIIRCVPETFHMLPWAGDGVYSVGEVLCETTWTDGSPMKAQPRIVARGQVEKLKQEFGLTITSGWEEEFVIVDKKTQKPLFEGCDISTHLLLAEHERLFLDMQTLMEKGGILVENFMSKYSSGQFEFITPPVDGIHSADMDFCFKQAAKEICNSRGKQAVFMTKPFKDGNSNGKHFNVSLWNDKNKNVFYDPDDELKISQLARHWVAGQIKHGPALAALLSPTVNCYRRLHKPWAPGLVNWAMDDRSVCFRAKNLGNSGSLVENRLPSSASNPYFVMAATIAAGLDGVRNKLTCPDQFHKDAVHLPKSLDEALTELENDAVMVEALGQEFINWFLQEKREIELEELKGFDSSIYNTDIFNKEHQLYYKYI